MRYNPKKHSLPPFKTSGVLLVDKPAGWTSFDVVNFVRGRFNIPKVGHCGTLDPAATGLMVIVLGRFTKLSQHFSGEDKIYEAKIQFGIETDSQDLDGTVTAEHDWSGLEVEQVKTTIMGFVGEQEQIPPMVSAKKKDGERLYKLARKGVVVERDPVEINIESIDISAVDLPFANFAVKCSKGTYIRTLCYDIGKKLGCGAVLNNLRRTGSGELELGDAVTIETLKEWGQPELEEHLNMMLFDKISKLSLTNI
ncbi:MAG: tRNA pseudouridine(55) synthase TruB [Victivallaceae bacterium]|nr:tRNA pseudouridine(55) synthase TruB [Victivallaceae bacterium]